MCVLLSLSLSLIHYYVLSLYVILSTHFDRQGVDISISVCLFVCLCVFVRLQIFPGVIKLAASNFARRFIGAKAGNFPFFVKFYPPEAENQSNRPAREGRWIFQFVTSRRSWNIERRVYAGSACVDRSQSQLTYLYLYAKTRRKVNPILGWSLPSSRITSSAIADDAEGPRDALCQLKDLANCCIAVRKITYQKTCSRWMTLKVTQSHQNCR